MDNGASEENDMTIEFRDFESGSSYKASLRSFVKERANTQFHVPHDWSVLSKDGTVKRYTVGTLGPEGARRFLQHPAPSSRPRSARSSSWWTSRRSEPPGMDSRIWLEAGGSSSLFRPLHAKRLSPPARRTI
jgi:hypothetical protein